MIKLHVLYNLTTMQDYTVCKQIAKEITLLRYIPEYQLYEISINWEFNSTESHSLHYLPEIFLYPYALKKDRPAQSTKVSEISVFSDTSLEEDAQPNSTLPLKRDSIYFKGEPSRQESLQQMDNRLHEIESVLNYDEASRKEGVKEILLKRNREILKFKEVRESKKRRKN